MAEWDGRRHGSWPRWSAGVLDAAVGHGQPARRACKFQLGLDEPSGSWSSPGGPRPQRKYPSGSDGRARIFDRRRAHSHYGNPRVIFDHRRFRYDSLPQKAVQRGLYSRKISGILAADRGRLRRSRAISVVGDSLFLSQVTSRSHGGGWEGIDPAIGRESGIYRTIEYVDSGGISRSE